MSVSVPPFPPHVQLSQGDLSDYPTLKKFIVDYVNGMCRNIGAVELRTVVARWNSTCAKHGKSVRDVLAELGAESRLAVHMFDNIGRTYVLSAESYAEILAKCDGMPDAYDWNTFGEALSRSSALVRRRIQQGITFNEE